MTETAHDESNPLNEHGTTETDESWRVRIFCSKEYFWLWIAQVISAMGDWIGFFAIAALAASISGNPEAATALVITARVAPSFFIGPFMGVLVDRYDRKVLMRVADIARALVFLTLPFVSTVWGLILASLVLELFTLMWSPAKESLVPNLVPRERLTTANSLGVLAAYGTMPFAGAIQFALAKGNSALADVSFLSPFQFDKAIGETQALAFYFDALTFLATAAIVTFFIRTVAMPRVSTSDAGEEVGDVADIAADDASVSRGANMMSGVRSAIADIKEGWSFIFTNRVVRIVNISLAAALLGGAILVPLGPTFAKSIIGDTNAFSLYITALGFGVAIGVAMLTALQQRLPKSEVFVFAEIVGGAAFLFGVSMSTFFLSALGVFFLGIASGAVYILGFTLLQENTNDELRGRTFTTFLTLIRLCVLGSMVLGPALSALLDPIANRIFDGRTNLDAPSAQLFGVNYAINGVRVTLWLGGLVVLGAGLYAARTLDLEIRKTVVSMFAWRPFSRSKEAPDAKSDTQSDSETSSGSNEDTES